MEGWLLNTNLDNKEMTVTYFKLLSQNFSGGTDDDSHYPDFSQYNRQCVLGFLSLGIKQPERETDHSPPSTAELKEWVELYILPLPQYTLMAWCSVKALGHLYLYIYSRPQDLESSQGPN
jgi:hypothetical protein